MALKNGGPPPLFSSLRGDVKGGFVAALISLPMSMSMGIVAFLPLGPEYAVQGGVAGIYGAIIVGIGALIFGGRVVMVPGPRAVVAMIFSSLAVHLLSSEDLMFPSGTSVPSVLTIGFLAIFLAGVLQSGLGFLKHGKIVKYIPQPVMAGFVNSSALLIVLAQLGILLDIPRQDNLWESLVNLDLMRPLTMVPGVVAIASMLAVQRWARALPASFLGLAMGSAAYYAMKYSLGGMDVGTTMGEVTTSLPIVHATDFISSVLASGDIWSVLAFLIPAVISMAAVGSMETVLSINAMDKITDHRTDYNRELGAQGAANAFAGLLGGLMASGGVIRTKPAYDMGGRTVLSGVFCSTVLLAAMLGFAELIEFIPRAVVAGVVVVLGIQIFDRWSLDVFRRCSNLRSRSGTNTLMDAGVILLVMVTALVFDLIVAVLFGIFVALIFFVVRMSSSLIRRIGRGPAIHSRSAWDENKQKIIEKHGHKISTVELEGALFFATADTLEDVVRELLNDTVRHIVLDMKRVTHIDSSGALVLLRIHRLISQSGGKLMIGYVPEERRRKHNDRRKKNREKKTSDRRQKGISRRLWKTLEEIGVVSILGEEMLFADTDSALLFCERDVITQTLQEQSTQIIPAKRMPAILNGLTREEIRILRRQFRRRFFRPGETIFEEGGKGDSLYFLTRGRADVSIYLSSLGQDKRLQTLMDGSIFGEMAILDSNPRAATVRAVEDTLCYRLSIEAFELIKQKYPEMTLKLFNNLSIMFSERMRSANTMISELEK
ncbi:MAG: SLC26A/SulP transporter family protein [Alphaproteobacteria bacterium]|nr:SLC26A/SulP transporter family protein [Alphaproteobacteria bacterium]